MKRAAAAVLALATLGGGLALVPATSGAAVTIKVTTTEDAVVNDGRCALREAIIAANTNAATGGCRAGSGTDTILLDAKTYVLNDFGPNEDATVSGDLDITHSVNIIGKGATRTVVRVSSQSDRAFDVLNGTARFRGLQITGGFAPNDSSSNPTGGGAIRKAFGANLILDRLLIRGNSASGTGGGVASTPSPDSTPPPPDGRTTILSSRFIGNSSDGVGAGFSSDSEANVVVKDSSFSINDGAGLWVQGATRVSLRNVRASQNFGDGIDLIATGKANVAGIRATNNYGGTGMALIATSDTTVRHVAASDNSIGGLNAIADNGTDVRYVAVKRNGASGLASIVSIDSVFRDIQSIGNVGNGLETIASNGTQFSSAVTRNNSAAGVSTVGDVNTKLASVKALGNDGVGLSLVAPATTKVRGSLAKDNAAQGIMAIAGTNYRFESTRTTSNDDSGMLLIATNGFVADRVASTENRSAGGGGGLFTISAQNSSFTRARLLGNKGASGGGLYQIAGITTEIASARITGNVGKTAGGGIASLVSSGTVIKNSTIANNRTTSTDFGTQPDDGSGGGLWSLVDTGTLVVSSTLSGNHASGKGGGVYGFGTGAAPNNLELTNTTVSGNSSGSGGARRGGGMYLRNAFVSLLNTTITRNSSAQAGGGIFALLVPEDPPDGDPSNDPQMVVSAKNTIVGAQAHGGECAGSGTFQSDGNNLGSDNSCFVGNNSLTGKNPKLLPLADNGGPTRTHMPRADSPAIDKGTNSGCPAKDQRGVTRPRTASNRCDIGAVERRRGSGPASASALDSTSTVLAGSTERRTCADRRDVFRSNDRAAAAKARANDIVARQRRNAVTRVAAVIDGLPVDGKVRDHLEDVKAHLAATLASIQVTPGC